jgi:hypothetical protein
MKIRRSTTLSLFSVLIILLTANAFAVDTGKTDNPPYPCKNNLMEVMFSPESQVRLRDGQPVDLSGTKAMSGVDEVLQKAVPYKWRRVCDVTEEKLDELQRRGELNTGTSVYNLNNIYRLRIADGLDIWSLSKELEALPGIITARPMPLPMQLPSIQPPDYQYLQGYLQPASSTPTGIDANYAWSQLGGDGTGITVCDIEYSWYNHNDISKLVGSQINPNQILDPFPAQRAFHGTAVAGVLVADDNGIGTTGICKGASLLTCGSYFIYAGNPPDTVWDVPAAIIMASSNMSPGDVILLEHQWDYNDTNSVNIPDFIPIEWWTCYHPNAQNFNGVHSTIWGAIAAGIHVVEAGGNGGAPTLNSGYNTDVLTWFPQHSGAIIVGAGGAYPGGTWAEGDRERISWASFGNRYDLQGWGEDVATTAYGDLDSTYGYYWMYTNSFDGTSSASPVVAAAVACCVGYWAGQGLSPASLIPPTLRNALVSTGTPQITPPFGNIGPRPNLQAAFAALKAEWTDVTSPPVDNYDQTAAGSAWGDYDGDGLLDLYVANGGKANRLFRNTAPSFADATAPPVDDNGVGYGVAWGDYDNDGDLDLYLANNGSSNRLFQNNGGGVFTDVTASPIDDPAGASQQVNWVDYDNDGDIDLYVTNYHSPNRLFRNDGGSWFDVTGSPVNYNGSSGGAAWADYDNDGDMDLYLACNYGETNHLYRNDGSGTFVDVTVPPLDDANEGLGVAWGDYDGDGDIDLYVVNNFGQANKMFENQGGTFVDPGTPVLNDNGWGLSAGWADYDNDGDLDIYVTNGSGPNKLFRNDGPGFFTDNTSTVIADTGYGMGFAWGDYDVDGDLDIYVPNAGLWQTCRLFRNEIGDDNNWLKIDLTGVVSNKNGIGARLRIVAGGVSQIREVTSGSGFCSMHSLTAEFGFGTEDEIDSLIVDWPSGTIQVLTNVNVNNHIQLVEPTTVVCGDANGDGDPNIGDAVYVISYVFKGGPPPVPVCRGDANDDGDCNIGDAVYMIAYVFKGGPAPVEPCCQ